MTPFAFAAESLSLALSKREAFLEVLNVSNSEPNAISRRSFCQSSLLAGSVLAAGTPGIGAAETAAQSAGALPQRVLGRTKVSVPIMTLGTAPCGLCPKIPVADISKIVVEALELGITAIDTAPAYIKSEEAIGKVLGSRRKEVFLSTKVLADTVEEAEESLAKSFRLLKTDWIDLVYYHSAGDHDVEKAVQPDGVFTWLVQQKKAGKFRFLGISGHNRPNRFVPLLETGEVDVLLTLVNFVDRFTYAFEDKVLPVARKHDVGIVAMKVFGGARKSTGSYENPDSPPELDVEHLQAAVRYALSTPGVATANLGVHNIQQLHKNLELVKQFTPLSKEEQQQLAKLGRSLAAKWGSHFGPIA